MNQSCKIIPELIELYKATGSNCFYVREIPHHLKHMIGVWVCIGYVVKIDPRTNLKPAQYKISLMTLKQLQSLDVIQDEKIISAYINGDITRNEIKKMTVWCKKTFDRKFNVALNEYNAQNLEEKEVAE